jgi:hypothetical protein
MMLEHQTKTTAPTLAIQIGAAGRPSVVELETQVQWPH